MPREIPGCWISKSVILENILPERKGLWDTNTTFVAKHHWWWAAVDHTALWQSQYREWHQFLSMNVSWESRIPRRENWSQRNNHNYYCREVTSCSPLIQSDWFNALSLDRTVQNTFPVDIGIVPLSSLTQKRKIFERLRAENLLKQWNPIICRLVLSKYPSQGSSWMVSTSGQIWSIKTGISWVPPK